VAVIALEIGDGHLKGITEKTPDRAWDFAGIFDLSHEGPL